MQSLIPRVQELLKLSTAIEEQSAVVELDRAEIIQLLSRYAELEELAVELSKENSLLKEQKREARSQMSLLKNSLSYRLGYCLISNSRSPSGWLRMPRALGRLALQERGARRESTSLRNDRSDSKGIFECRLLYEASQIAQRTNWTEAIDFIDQHGNPNHWVAAKLFRANAAIDDDDAWLMHANSYLAQFGLTPLALRCDQKPRFFRLTAEPRYAVSEGPKVSIIMPAYNAEKTISFAVNSILAQTWRNIELIVIDDNSADDTWLILQQLANRDERIKLLRNSINVGPYVSKNRALSIVTGAYLTGHDADDWAHPQRIEKHLEFMRSAGNVEASLSSMLRCDQQGIFRQFLVAGTRSFDGAAQLASISCMFETSAFRERLGHWDAVRFGADSEIMDRARLLLGASFQDFRGIGLICLDSEGSLTNHPTHGVRRDGSGVSPIRRAYREAFKEWHQSMSLNEAKLPLVHHPRLFDAPEEMKVSAKAIESCGETLPDGKWQGGVREI